MAEPLHSRTALGNAVAQRIEIGPYCIVERFDVALASLAPRRGRGNEVVLAAKTLQLPLPGPSRLEEGPALSAFWVAPGMWFVEASFATHEDIVSYLKPAFRDSASITEQTDAWVRFDLRAPALGPLMERLCNVDFASAPVGFATRTVIEHLGCYLILRGDGLVTLYGPRSSAKSLLHALCITAQALT